jgi:hypothetical protein
MSRQPHPPRLYNSNYTWRRVQIMRLLVMQLSPPSRHSIPLWPKYSPQHPVLKHPQFMFLNVNFNAINSVALSPQVNYTDRAIATCRLNLVPTFVDRGVSRGQRGGSRALVNISFLHRSRYFSLKLLLIYPHKGWVDHVPDPLLLRKSGSAVNRTRVLGSVARNSDH